jgi:hypothetical protein
LLKSRLFGRAYVDADVFPHHRSLTDLRRRGNLLSGTEH